MAVDMSKIEREAPQLVTLAKSAGVTLEKIGFDTHRARVALAMDISPSMRGLYSSGKVQQLAERVFSLGLHFDDNGAIDLFLFNHAAREEGEMTLSNFKNYSASVSRQISGGTNYAPVMRMMREAYFPETATTAGTAQAQPAKAKRGLFGLGRRKEEPAAVSAPAATTTAGDEVLPVYVMFVTDGETSQEHEVKAEIKRCAALGIFFHFLAIGPVGDPKFDFLRGLDEMKGRALDNASFCEVPDPSSIDERELYAEMMSEYPGWVRDAQAKGFIS